MALIDERGRKVITEQELRGASSGDRLRIDSTAILTPLARDLVMERGIEIESVSRASSWRSYRIAIGADHGGYQAKEAMKALLVELGHDFCDFGTNSTEAVDYPDFAHLVAIAVARGQFDLGIVLDGAGIGSCIAANKVPGVRAAMCYDAASARNSREHNDANVLTLGAKMLPIEKLREVVKVWLSTDISEDRHRRRVEKIGAIEQRYLRDR
jgi:ribose 5-phosphate isomerase B